MLVILRSVYLCRPSAATWGGGPPERCQSGRMGLSRKQKCSQGHRGFESLPLRRTRARATKWPGFFVSGLLHWTSFLFQRRVAESRRTQRNAAGTDTLRSRKQRIRLRRIEIRKRSIIRDLPGIAHLLPKATQLGAAYFRHAVRSPEACVPPYFSGSCCHAAPWWHRNRCAGS